MARFGVDYSTGPPTIQELKDAKVTFVGRYVSKPGAAKNLTLAEAERLSEAGIDIAIFFQIGRGFMISNRDRGRRDARSGLAQAHECGMPEGRPIYFAPDIDPNPLSAALTSGSLSGLFIEPETSTRNTRLAGGRCERGKS